MPDPRIWQRAGKKGHKGKKVQTAQHCVKGVGLPGVAHRVAPVYSPGPRLRRQVGTEARCKAGRSPLLYGLPPRGRTLQPYSTGIRNFASTAPPHQPGQGAQTLVVARNQPGRGQGTDHMQDREAAIGRAHSITFAKRPSAETFKTCIFGHS